MLSLFKKKNPNKQNSSFRCSSQPTDNEQKVSDNESLNLSQQTEENAMSDEIIENENSILQDESLTLRDKIELALHTVYDPEIPVDIMELGLVYKIDIKEDNVVFITMTLTAPACPVAGEIVIEVGDKVKAIEEVKDAHVQLTFDPPWTKEMMSDEARLELGFM